MRHASQSPNLTVLSQWQNVPLKKKYGEKVAALLNLVEIPRNQHNQ
jgi:hypothetical protein